MDAKKEAIFRKLDKRNEDHQALKERNKEARLEEDESIPALDKLNAWTATLAQRLEDEISNGHQENKAQDILNELSGELQELDSFFTEKSPVLTPYDIRKLQNNVNDLRAKFSKLQDVLKPKKKFGFRRDKKKIGSQQEDLKKQELMKSSEAVTQDLGVTYKEKVDENICIANVDGQDVMLSNLKNCRIVMKSNPVTLHMTHLENCTFLGGPVQTSIYMEDCNHCTLSLACQQLRAHNSVDTKINLHVTSKGIIEDCDHIQVSPYNITGLDDQFAKLGLRQDINHWDQLDDFNWLASDSASPHWKIVSNGESINFQHL